MHPGYTLDTKLEHEPRHRRLASKNLSLAPHNGPLDLPTWLLVGGGSGMVIKSRAPVEPQIGSPPANKKSWVGGSRGWRYKYALGCILNTNQPTHPDVRSECAVVGGEFMNRQEHGLLSLDVARIQEVAWPPGCMSLIVMRTVNSMHTQRRVLGSPSMFAAGTNPMKIKITKYELKWHKGSNMV